MCVTVKDERQKINETFTGTSIAVVALMCGCIYDELHVSCDVQMADELQGKKMSLLTQYTRRHQSHQLHCSFFIDSPSV